MSCGRRSVHLLLTVFFLHVGERLLYACFALGGNLRARPTLGDLFGSFAEKTKIPSLLLTPPGRQKGTPW